MVIAEKIQQYVQELPDILQEEALDFVEYLLAKAKYKEEVIDMCRRNGFLQYTKLLEDIIHESYQGLESIEYELLEPMEPNEQEKLCIVINVRAKPKQVLEDEKKFNSLFFEKIPREKRSLISFTYNVS